jgi:hypothetical protein
MTLTSISAAEMTELYALGLALFTYRITVEDGTGYVVHRTTVQCTRPQAEAMALRFLTVWRQHAVITEQLDD